MMRSPVVFGTCLLLVRIALGANPDASAQDSAPSEEQITNRDLADAEDAFWKGKSSYDEGSYAEALTQFQTAYRLTNDPDVLYNIAQTYRKMGRCVLARDGYRRFTQLAPRSPLAAQAESLAMSCSEPKTDVTTSPINQPAPAIVAYGSVPTKANDSRLTPHDVPAQPSSHAGLGTTRTWGVALVASGFVAGGIATGLAIWNRDRYQDWQNRDRELALGNAFNEPKADWVTRQASNDRLGQSIQRVDREVLLLSIGASALVVAASALLVAPRHEDAKFDKRVQADARLDNSAVSTWGKRCLRICDAVVLKHD